MLIELWTCILGVTKSHPALLSGDRPLAWAQPVKESILAQAATDLIPNWHVLNPQLSRGANPKKGGFKVLEAAGFKSVISFRAWKDDLSGTSLKMIHIPMLAWYPKQEDIELFLRTVKDVKNHPVFFHCQHGADRTGLMCAMARLVIEHWSKKEALAEMLMGGYGFHPLWRSLLEYVNDVDVRKFAL